MYMLLFHCRAVGGELRTHPLETADVGWFSQDRLPWPIVAADRWAPIAFSAIRGEPLDVSFDLPRNPVWRGQEG
jgi:hypothetical protein